MRRSIAALLLCAATAGAASGSSGIGSPSLSIAIDLPSYPQLAPVPGHPVYYAPGLMSNYFFYDGLYWVYQDGTWHASAWYNGPWGQVAPDDVPGFLLRVPVRYYRRPPADFRGWREEEPPRWNERWGAEWEQRRDGWKRGNQASIPARAPLPTYQSLFRADAYPRADKQRALLSESYRYRPRERVVREHYRAHAAQIPTSPPRRKVPGRGLSKDDVRG